VIAQLGELTVYDRTPPDQVVERSREADVLIINKTPLTANILAQLPRLKFIAVIATGYNVVDTTARERGIPVSNVPVYGTNSVAQYAFALLLELCHRVGMHDAVVKEGKWSSNVDWCFWLTPLVELVGKRMGIIGFGRIGRRVGEIAHVFGMEVLAYDVWQGNSPSYEPFAWREIREVFAEADVITLHCLQTAENTGMVNREVLSLMKSSAFFINDARGGLVVEQDLADALNSGRIAGAAVDVVSTEPIRPDNPLLTAHNCIITPHMAWGALEARQRIMVTTAENISAWLAGKPINVVNL
jgi:glycerate dehydrogenase